MIKIILLTLILGTHNNAVPVQVDSLQFYDIHSILESLQNKIEIITQKHDSLEYTIIAQSDSINIVKEKLDTFNKNKDSIINSLRNKIELQNISLNELEQKGVNLQQTIDSLNIDIQINRSTIESVDRNFGVKIQEAEQQTESEISQLKNSIYINRLYWIIATLVMLLLGAMMYLFLGKRIKSSQTDVETQIRNTKKSLEEESLKLDNKLIEVLESQLKIQQEESKSKPITTNEKSDHSLALKVADEIVRMQKNISRMDADIKGLKPLEKGIERIQANFAANGYEMVNLLNNEYDERMNIDVINFVEDDTLESGKKIISKIIKPQVNFNGILIQRAQVEVSQN
jgi:hypothetical protein